jgi:8-oxo-dGTP diphosphatase
LLAQRAVAKPIAPGKYHLPGGHVEWGEHPADALVRELGEELGVRLQVAEPLWTFHYLRCESHTVGIVYRVPLIALRDLLRWDTSDLQTCAWVKEEGRRGTFRGPWRGRYGHQGP